MHEIELHRRAQRQLRRIPENRRTKILKALHELSETPNPALHINVKQMRGDMAGYYRMRVGSYRIVFEILETDKGDEIKLLYVNGIDSRGNIY